MAQPNGEPMGDFSRVETYVDGQLVRVEYVEKIFTEIHRARLGDSDSRLAAIGAWVKQIASWLF